MDTRAEGLKAWLTVSCGFPEFKMEKMAGDASFRRYFRIHINGQSFVAMDAPPGRENCAPYIAIADTLRGMGLHTPEIIKQDVSLGYLLISDFGDRVYLKELTSANASQLYTHALDSLVVMQSCRTVDNWTLPFFTAKFMRQELELFKEWFLHKYLQLTLSVKTQNQLNQCFDFLTEIAAKQTQVFMHRDYHSANLMLLPDNRVGILDFQDAFIGPVTYDLVSLLRDCYISWPDKLIEPLVMQYWHNLQLHNVSQEEFMRWFDLMGVQRHLKALLTFSRKFHRDHNWNYLQHIPRTLEYVANVSARHPECKMLNEFLMSLVTACVE